MIRAIVVTAALLMAAEAFPRDSGPRAFESRLLAVIPEDLNVIVPPAFSRDGRLAAYAARGGGVDRVVRDGRPGPAYDFV